MDNLRRKMKLSCTQQNLTRGLSIISRAITTRGTLPVLANVMIAGAKGRVMLAATDLEIAISTYIGAKVEKEGSITVPAKLLSEFVFANDDPTISIELTEGSAINVYSQHHKAQIKGIAPEEFPIIPEVKKEHSFQLSAPALKQALEQVGFAAAIDETRPILTGVLIKAEKNELILAATDSYRLAEKRILLGGPVESPVTAIAPAKSINELARIIDETIDLIQITIGENQIKAVVGQTELVSRLIEGTFPDYLAIIPDKATTKAVVDTRELAGALKVASYFAREVANNIKITIGKDDKIVIHAVSPQAGQSTSTLTAVISGEALEIAFNGKFLADGLQALGQEKALLSFSGSLSPGGLYPGDGSKDYLYIVMPLKLEQ